MTREEAIKRLKSVGIRDALQEDYDALDMAIEALEQESCECFTCKYGEWVRQGWDITMADDKCGSCCSWNDKYEPLEQEQYYKDLASSYEKTINKLTKAISEQEPKTGHWESWTKGRVMCSVCKREPFNGKGAEGLKYCPHCGCRMMESEG